MKNIDASKEILDKPVWNKPELTSIDISETLGGTGSCNDGQGQGCGGSSNEHS